MAVRITCINKSGGAHYDRHHAISHLGWQDEQTGQTGKSSRVDVYQFLKQQNGRAYVKDTYGNVAEVMPRESPNGTPFVQTVANGKWTDNLLSLMECL